ncbi:hypothetical protein RRSWK_01701 [Rhodopirellula sp. SWK7]|nr:hypothetical protein RRSWK_01701 [Rhodopirellula sp. SWK7]
MRLIAFSDTPATTPPMNTDVRKDAAIKCHGHMTGEIAGCD